MKNFFKSYRDLEVWQKSMVLAKEVYQVTSGFPKDEKFGLTNQMRRAAVSIPSNLALLNSLRSKCTILMCYRA